MGWMDVLSGASSGAAAGSALGPWGTAGGALLGALGGSKPDVKMPDVTDFMTSQEDIFKNRADLERANLSRQIAGEQERARRQMAAQGYSGGFKSLQAAGTQQYGQMAAGIAQRESEAIAQEKRQMEQLKYQQAMAEFQRKEAQPNPYASMIQSMGVIGQSAWDRDMQSAILKEAGINTKGWGMGGDISSFMSNVPILGSSMEALRGLFWNKQQPGQTVNDPYAGQAV